MKKIRHIEFYFGLISVSAIFLFAHHYIHTEFFLHLAAIPLEILLGVFIVEKFLDNKDKKDRLQELFFIKSCAFRSDMRKLFLANFDALKFPVITISKIKDATLAELRQMRSDAEIIEYKSLEAMERVVIEYVKAENVWHTYKDIVAGSRHNFSHIFQDMIFILHFIYDVKLFKWSNPNALFMYEAQKNTLLMEKAKKVLSGGIKKFLDFAIELKEKEPVIFSNLLSDYELYTQMTYTNRKDGGTERRQKERRGLDRRRGIDRRGQVPVSLQS